MTLELTASGALRSVAADDRMQLNLLTVTDHDLSYTGIYLRRRDGDAAEPARITGPGAARVLVGPDAAAPTWVRWEGEALGASTRVTVTQTEDGGLRWDVLLAPATALPARGGEVPARGGEHDQPAEYDLVLVQDLSLTPRFGVAANPLYSSHYVAHHLLESDGLVQAVASRQTSAYAPELPLALTGWDGGARGALTEAYDLVGTAARATGRPALLETWDWPVSVRQFEQSVISLASVPFRLDGTVARTARIRITPDYRGPLAEARDAFGPAAPVHRAVPFDSAAPVDPATPVGRGGGPAEEAGEGSAGRTGEGAIGLGTDRPVPSAIVAPAASVLAGAALLSGQPIPDAELEALSAGRRGIERAPGGQVWSWFSDDGRRHTVTGAKELVVERSHGAILLSAAQLDPGTPHLTATTWAPGVFASHLAFGNTNFHRVLGIQRDPLGLLRSHGVRLLVRHRGTADWSLLTVPSLWESEFGRTRWIYRLADGQITVTTTMASGAPALAVEVSTDLDLEARFTVEVDRDDTAWRTELPDPGTVLLAAEDRGAAYALSGTGSWHDDAELWEDGRARDGSMLVLTPSAAHGARVLMTAGRDGAEARAVLARLAPTLESAPADTAQGATDRWAAGHVEAIGSLTGHLDLPASGPLAEFGLLLPWFAHDALVHVLAPHGLEQASGAAWGTRDVCQGPFEFALAFGHLDICRDLLVRIFAHQKRDGDWPQWFMFDEYRALYAPDSHGDVAVWPLVALGEYLAAGGDLAVLQDEAPFLDTPESETSTIADHLTLLLDHLDASRVAGSVLPAYAHGDWDDTLQPADDSLRATMASTWTTALLAGAARDLAERLPDGGTRSRLGALAGDLTETFRSELVIDGVVPGFVRLDGQAQAGDGVNGAGERSIVPLIHPRDTETGLTYRLISLTQPVLSALLDAETAAAQERTVRKQLDYADGAHLMDRPVTWHEGRALIFKRGEQSAYFGREVGLMYTHAHLRWSETLAALGRHDAFERLLRISPIGARERLGDRALPRQRNCYYSSLDAVFATRQDASDRWDEVRDGTRPVAGGWRVYSSGPGIVLRILAEDLLGVRRHRDEFEFDPLLPDGSSGFSFGLDGPDGSPLRVEVIRDRAETGDVALELNGRPLEVREVPGPYRRRGVAVASALLAGGGTLTVHAG